MQGQHMLWCPYRNYLQTTLNCHEINVNFNIVVALLFVSIMMVNQHTVGPSTLSKKLLLKSRAVGSLATALDASSLRWVVSTLSALLRNSAGVPSSQPLFIAPWTTKRKFRYQKQQLTWQFLDTAHAVVAPLNDTRHHLAASLLATDDPQVWVESLGEHRLQISIWCYSWSVVLLVECGAARSAHADLVRFDHFWSTNPQ